jgi:hypothetical protein
MRPRRKGAQAMYLISGGGRYLLVSLFTDIEARQRTVNAPEIQEFLQAHPMSEFGGAITGTDIGAVVYVAVPAMVA